MDPPLRSANGGRFYYDSLFTAMVYDLRCTNTWQLIYIIWSAFFHLAWLQLRFTCTNQDQKRSRRFLFSYSFSGCSFLVEFYTWFLFSNNNNNNNLFYSCRIYTCFVIILAMPPLLDKRRLTNKALSLSEYSSVTNHTCYIQYSQCDIFISVLATWSKENNMLQHIHSTTPQTWINFQL